VPEVRRTERLRRIVTPARTEWREVLCGTNATKARLAEVQRALNARGFQTASDGVFGPQTLQSMEAFQRANNLAVGYLTIETVNALGVAKD
jgi:peptidoglycan hydrolase-like protein with peptidoglycan-binding domain